MENQSWVTDISVTSSYFGFVLFTLCYRYDPVIREHYEWSQSPTSWSMQRYMFIHNALTNYQAEAKEIGERLHYNPQVHVQ